MTFSIKSWWIIAQLRAFITNADDLLTQSINWVYNFAFTPACWRLCLIAGSLGMTLGAAGYIYWLMHVQVIWLCLPSIWLFIFSALLLMLRWTWKRDTEYKQEFRREMEARQQV